MTQVTNNLPYNFTPTPPTLKDLLNIFEQNLLVNFNCHHIGTIQTFDSELQTAKATINYQKTSFTLNSLTQQYQPTMTPYPVLVDCPLIVLSGGSSALTFPIAQGDQCLVLFNDRDMDNWFAGSSTSGVATPRLHSFSDAIILVGLNSLQTFWDFYDSVRAVLRAGEVSGSIVAVGVNPSNSKVLVTNTYPTNSVTLNTLLQQLVTDTTNLISALTANASTFILITGATGTPSALNPTIVTALTSVSSSLSALATAIGGLLE